MAGLAIRSTDAHAVSSGRAVAARLGDRATRKDVDRARRALAPDVLLSARG
jgi:hypothetical protein